MLLLCDDLQHPPSGAGPRDQWDSQVRYGKFNSESLRSELRESSLT